MKSRRVTEGSQRAGYGVDCCKLAQVCIHFLSSLTGACVVMGGLGLGTYSLFRYLASVPASHGPLCSLYRPLPPPLPLSQCHYRAPAQPEDDQSYFQDNSIECYFGDPGSEKGGIVEMCSVLKTDDE